MILRLPSASVPGISDAVVASGLIFISGQTADPAAHLSFEGQVDAAFENLTGILEHFQVPPRNLVRVTMHATQLATRDLGAIRRIRDRWIDTGHPPASTLTGVDALALPGLSFEVDAVCLAADPD